MTITDFLRRATDVARAGLPKNFRTAGEATDSIVRSTISANPGEPGSYADSPLTSDELNFAPWVETEVSLLIYDMLQTPLSLTIDGPWGCGKSTFMNMIYRALIKARDNEWLLVWLDPSLIEGRASVIDTIGERVRLVARQRARDLRAAPETIAYRPMASEPPSDKWIAAAKKDADEWLKTWEQAWIPTRSWTSDTLLKLMHDTRYAILGRQCLGKIVLCIDDLDRCEPSVVMEFLRIHRILLNCWNIVIVYSMEYNVVAQLVGKEITTSGSVWGTPGGNIAEYHWSWGARYLEKFCGRRIRPPEPTEDTIQAWLGKLLGDSGLIGGLSKALWWGLRANPRRIKAYANMCGQLFRACELAPVDNQLWMPLKALPPVELRGLILKVIALAVGWPTVYEVARVTTPDAMRAAEQAVRDGRPVSRIRGGRFEQDLADEGLSALLLAEPSFRRSSAELAALLAVCEPYLGLPTYRYGIAAGLEAISFGANAGEEGQKGEAILQEDAARVVDVLTRWRDAGPVSVLVVETLRQSPPPLKGVEAFKSRGYSPSCSSLVLHASDALRAVQKDVGRWFAAATVVHPECDAESVLQLEELLRNADEEMFGIDIMQVAEGRIADADQRSAVRRRRLVMMARTGNPQLEEEAISESLLAIGLDVVAVRKGAVELAQKCSVADVLCAADILQYKDEHETELRLLEAAMNTAEGRQSTAIIRNIARVLYSLSREEEARKLFLVAAALDSREDQAIAWYSNRFVQSGTPEKVLFLQAAVRRDPNDASYWADIGANLHNQRKWKEARPWLEASVSLAPRNPEYLEGLAKNVGLLEGPSRAADVMAGRYETHPDIGGLLQVAEAADREVMGRVLKGGVVEYGGRILFDPGRPPTWMREMYPELFDGGQVVS
jgi:tetratricopeptide (TPR) repeat protein